MSSLLLIPPLTEISMVKEQLDFTPYLSVSELQSSSLSGSVRSVFFDFTFDFFNPEVTLPFLWEKFSVFYGWAEEMKSRGIHLTVLRNYPFSTNRQTLNLRKTVLEQFSFLLKEFFGSNEVFVPTVFSRSGLKRLYHPITRVIEAIRMGKTHRSEVSEKSRFFLLYETDFISSFLSHAETGVHESMVIEGNELFLKQLNEEAQILVGHAPVSFHRTDFVNYHYPDGGATSLNEIHYGFENMMVDLVNYLF